MNQDPPATTMQAINRLLQVGDYGAAQAQLAALAAMNPGDGEVQRLFGGVKLALGDVPGAERVLRAAAALDPAWPPVLTMLGELLLNGGRASEAEPFLLRAAHSTPADPRAAVVLARHLNDRQRFAEALDVAAPFCRGGKASEELATQHVKALVALGRAGEAVAFHRTALARAPDDPSAAHALALALQASGEHAAAESTARNALAHGHGSAALFYTRARSLVALGRFEAAEADLRDCLRMEPRRVDAHDDLARLVWMRTGDAAQATAVLDAALRQFPNDDPLCAAKAAILQGAGDARAAWTCLEAGVAREHAPPALLVRAGLAALEFDPALARDTAARVLRALPDNAPARKLLAASLLGTGDARAALTLCEALVDAEPTDQYLLALQATAWRMLGDARYARLCDYRKWVVPYRLEAPAGWCNVADFLGDLKCSLGVLHDALQHPLLFQSLRHGTETTNDLARSDDPVVQALFKAFDAPVRDYMHRIGHGDDALQRRNSGRYRFNGSWSVRLRSSGFHHNHVHPRGWISSACYIELPHSMSDPGRREGVLTFGEPGLITTPALPPEHEVRPEAGMLVLFPSFVWHGTVPFADTGTRLTVAFDAVPA